MNKINFDTINFHHDCYANGLITGRDWRQLHIENLNRYEFKELINENYPLNPDASKSMCFSFITFRGTNRRAINITMIEKKIEKQGTNEDGKVNINII